MDPDLTIRIRIPNWRERLTKVERLLAEFYDRSEDEMMGADWDKVQQALAEVRSLLGRS